MNRFEQLWWFRLPVPLRRVSKLLSEAWIDGIYLTAWPNAAMIVPPAIFLFGLFEGATHWSFATYASQQVSSHIYAVDFAQMLPMLFVAVICGALSSQLGLLLVLGFALGDLFIAGSPFGYGPDPVWNLFHLHVPQLISYLAFFLLAVTPALTGKAMAASLPPWVRRPRMLWVSLTASIFVAVQGVSVYAWTLAVPMIVRVQWLWVRQQPPVSVISFLPHVDPWLPLTASAAMAFRLWLSSQAKGKLDTSGIAAARTEMLALDRKAAANVMSAVLGGLGSAVVVIALICGLFDSITRGIWVFVIVAGLFLTRNLVLPTVPVWVWWSQAVNRIPLLLRWVAAVVGTFMVTRLIVSNPAYSPAHNLTPGAFGVEIFCFLLGLAASMILMPAPAKSAAPPTLTRTAREGAKALAFVFILALATRAAHADVCLDPFCCFGGQVLLAALVVAALIATLPLILAFAELAELGVLAAEASEAAVAAAEEAEIAAAESRLVPLGFESAEQFEAACTELDSALTESGITDGTVGVRGSSVTGSSFKTGLPFGPESDIDVFVESDQLTAGLPANAKSGMVYPGAIADNFPAIAQWSDRWARILGRPIDVAGFPIGRIPATPHILW